MSLNVNIYIIYIYKFCFSKDKKWLVGIYKVFELDIYEKQDQKQKMNLDVGLIIKIKKHSRVI